MRGLPEVIDGIGGVSQIVRRAPSFDPSRQPGFGDEHGALWTSIDGRRTVRDLVLHALPSPLRAIAVMRQMSRWGAITLEVSRRARTGSDVDDDIEIVDMTELGAVTADEARILSEDVELEPWERRRILAFVRLVRQGRYLELLGVLPTASKRELKRAYYQISKEFHPDRYYGKRLGSFAALLDRIFEATTEAVRALSAQSRGPGEPRRRMSERFHLAVPVRVRCSAWPEPLALMTQDVSEGGVFVQTEVAATPGQRASVELPGPSLDDPPLVLRGKVVFWRAPALAARVGRPPGIALAFDPLEERALARFARIVAAARREAPAPADPPDAGKVPEVVPRARKPRGSGPIRRPSPIVGIDFGTTYTCISAAVGNRVSILPWPDGSRCIPSVVGFPAPGRYEIGAPARGRLLTDPKHTVPAPKRLLGRQAGESEVERHLSHAAFDTGVGPEGGVMVEMWGESYAVAQLCAYLLRAAREAAEQALGLPVERAVFTVPVSFGPERLEVLRRAAKLAHIQPVQIIDEPSAAALANRFRPEFGGLVGVYDFGGGTFDFSVVDASAGDFRVLGTAGDSWLGGDDFDFAVAEAVANQFWRVHGVDLRLRAVEWQHLLFACERAKRHLSDAEVASIFVPEVMRTALGAQDLRMRLTRDPVERVWSGPIGRSLATCLQALTPLGLEPSDLSIIYLSGGTSYIPAVQRALQEHFSVPVRIGVPPEYAACLGAGIHAAQLERESGLTLPGRD